MDLMGIGLNGAMFDIEFPKVKVAPVFVDDEEKIKHIVENCLINKAGGLYKTTGSLMMVTNIV
jgi:hypothetical protein